MRTLQLRFVVQCLDEYCTYVFKKIKIYDRMGGNENGNGLRVDGGLAWVDLFGFWS